MCAAAATVETALFYSIAECLVHLQTRVQLAATAGTGSATTTSKPEQLRERLEKETKPDLIEKCKAAGISGYSKKRKEELIDLLLRKKPVLGSGILHRRSCLWRLLASQPDVFGVRSRHAVCWMQAVRLRLALAAQHLTARRSRSPSD